MVCNRYFIYTILYVKMKYHNKQCKKTEGFPENLLGVTRKKQKGKIKTGIL